MEENTDDAQSYEVSGLPKPARFANYDGDRRQMLGGIYGPNETCEIMCDVDVDYDFETNTSRVGFAFATLPMIRAAFRSEGYYEIAPAVRQRAANAITVATMAGV
ncbi:hypothetical protein LGT39_05895 [Demequina sp. TTPB684]|uniref:hypothetical protein n=1 Tax=unclassified Demequina TaxID=2620311 RepID=UPI001CF5629D|nr:MULTISPECIES: hypothetical protein [unclassified Demequina]MCB2412380.1 hypothetical protein [Demequina sp. TTPB684]UPU89050.1 hypothetical protein LGT36_003750 [Demequina sp. TMPB413]